MNYSAYKLGKLALLGNVKELLLYRLVDGKQKKGTLTLKDTTENSAKDVIKLETKYPTARNFNVTIKSNLVDADKRTLYSLKILNSYLVQVLKAL